MINPTAKKFIHRIRPDLWESSNEEYDTDAVLLILAWNSYWRWLILIFGSLFVVAIGWTRLYLGVHFGIKCLLNLEATEEEEGVLCYAAYKLIHYKAIALVMTG